MLISELLRLNVKIHLLQIPQNHQVQQKHQIQQNHQIQQKHFNQHLLDMS